MRKFLQFIGGGLLLAAAGCPVSVPALCDYGACESGDGGADGDVTDGGADVVQPPPGCDPAVDPKDAPKCVVTDFGVFVDATGGADANPGTKESPVKSITAALGKIANKNRVYVCEGTYAEHVKLTSAVSIYGGFACGTWTYSGNKPKVAPTDAGYALEVRNVSAALTIADVGFASTAGTADSVSSVAAFVTSTPSLTLKRADLVAGAGFHGKNEEKAGTLALTSSTPKAATLNGSDGTATLPGAAQLCTCAGGGTSKGGLGGGLNGDGSKGDVAQVPSEPAFATGLGSTFGECAGGQGGRPGSNAPSVMPASGASTVGVLSATGWTPAQGVAGSAGVAGQGGGGGGGGANACGGGGGCGGCGGQGGGGGGGGGASVGLIALNSPVVIAAGKVTTAAAGAGGAGGAGGDGANGGGGGAKGGVGASTGCPGGDGGKGGGGVSGGGGAGGVSAPVMYKGAAPTNNGSTLSAGAKGEKGVGGTPGTNDGVDGQSIDLLAIQ